MSNRVTDLVVETLEAAGVRRCYGIVSDTRKLSPGYCVRTGAPPSPATMSEPSVMVTRPAERRASISATRFYFDIMRAIIGSVSTRAKVIAATARHSECYPAARIPGTVAVSRR
jgi:hypothetical protein